MTTIVETCWGPRRIDDTPYWHLVKASELFVFNNNVRFGKGALWSVSALVEDDPHMSGAATWYSATHRGDAKEVVFEDIRRTAYPSRPSRLGALYVFDGYSLGQRALTEWFPNETRIVRECRLLLDSVTHRADTAWLDAPPDAWAANAYRYWDGAMSATPFPEVLVHGAVYFPGWELFSDA